MSTQVNTIKLPALVLEALREAAARECKSLEEIAAESIMAGLASRSDRKLRLTALMEQGHRRAASTHGSVDEQTVVDIVHDHRRGAAATPGN